MASTDIISTLGAGSGVDVKSLANSLVEAEKAPRKAAIEAKIKKTEGGVSGFAAIKFVLNDLKTAFSNIKDQSAFNAVVPRVSQASAIGVTATANASSGSHSTIGLYRRELFQQPWCNIPEGNPAGTKAALAPLLRKAMDEARVSAELYTGRWTDVGTPERLALLNV